MVFPDEITERTRERNLPFFFARRILRILCCFLAHGHSGFAAIQHGGHGDGEDTESQNIERVFHDAVGSVCGHNSQEHKVACLADAEGRSNIQSGIKKINQDTVPKH